MDAFDYVDVHKAPPTRKISGLVWNLLTLLVLLGTLIAGVVFLTIFVDPHSSINPFPPPTMFPTAAPPTPTTTPRIALPATWTPGPTPEPTSTDTPRPSPTPTVTETPIELPGEPEQPEPSLTPGGMSFILQQGSPQAIPNIYHLDAGCNWMGVAGQATSLNGEPVVGLFIQLGGVLEGRTFETRLSMTGTAPGYGRGGYEFVIADRPITSTGGLWVQLLDQASLPLSDKIYFDTFEDCQKNLILINFVQVR